MFQDPSMVVNEQKIYRSTGVEGKQPKKKENIPENISGLSGSSADTNENIRNQFS